MFETLQRRAQLTLLDYQGHRVGIEKVPDGLHLRKDEAPTGSLLVHRHHQHGEAVGPDEVGEYGRVLDEMLGSALEKGLAEVEDTLEMQSGYPHCLDLEFGQPFRRPGRHRRPAVDRIHLVEDDYRGGSPVL